MELVINNFGVSLNRKDSGFLINYKDGEQLIPASAVTSININSGAQITSDAVLLALEHEIEIVFTDKGGNIIGRIWSPKFGSISTIRKGQLAFTFTPDAVEWIKKIVKKKIESQQAMLLTLSTEDFAKKNIVNRAVRRLEDYCTKVAGVTGEVVSDVAPTLRGWEGVSSKIYFDALNEFLPEHLKFESRSQHPAKDVINAFLNYGYGILYGKIEGAMIKAGIDPYIGVMHRDNYNRPVLVYDVIELYRIWVDYVVYTLALQDVITDEYYSIKDDGSYWLEALGRRVLIQSLNDYLDEIVIYNGLSRSRRSQIALYCHNLAQYFKKFERR